MVNRDLQRSGMKIVTIESPGNCKLMSLFLDYQNRMREKCVGFVCVCSFRFFGRKTSWITNKKFTILITTIICNKCVPSFRKIKQSTKIVLRSKPTVSKLWVCGVAELPFAISAIGC